MNQFRASLLVAQDILAPAPVADPEAVVAKHLVRYGRLVDTVAAPKAVVFARVPLEPRALSSTCRSVQWI